MGWSGGTEVIRETWKVVREHAPEKDRVKVLVKLIRIFTDHDWDCVDELVGPDWPESKKAVKQFNREMGWDEKD